MDKHRSYLHLSEEAKSNYQQIKHYLIREFGVPYFNVFSEMLLGTLTLIAINPYLFPIFDEVKNIRRAVVRKEVSIFYEISEDENEVMILSIFDNRRDTPDFNP